MGPPARRSPARPWRRVASVLAVLAVAAGPVLAGARPEPVAASTPGPALVLAAQSAWVRSGGTWQAEVILPPGDPADTLQVAIAPRLVSRSAFDEAARGLAGAPVWSSSIPVKDLRPGPGGQGVLVSIPVDPTKPPAKGPQPFYSGSSMSGVYPVQLRVVTPEGAPAGAPLSTFLVERVGPSFAPVDVAVTVPVGARPVLRHGRVAPLPPAVVSSLDARVQAVGTAGVPASLLVQPETVDAAGTARAGVPNLASDLATLVRGGDELLPDTYVPVSPAALVGAGRSADLGRQVHAGAATLGARLGTRPTGTDWVVPGRIGPEGAAALTATGISQLVVSGTDLSTLPPDLTTTTYARPTRLSGTGTGAGGPVEVIGADPVLDGRLDGPTRPVLAAEQDLAELAMIQLETPSVRRGVALILPATAPPALVTALLSGLAANPFVHPVTVAGLFAALGHPTPILSQRLLPAPTGSLPDAGALGDLAAKADALASALPGTPALTAPIDRQLLLAESSALSPGEQAAAIAVGDAAVDRVVSRVTLAGPTSVTLTSRDASIPVTIGSDPAQPIHVTLQLSSNRLIFRQAKLAQGSCEALSDLETCSLVLQGPATTLRLPVETRGSGVFPLLVDVRTPDGGLDFANLRDTVRSTAFSFVALALMGLALAFLAVWWINNARHGRRARALVPRPGDDDGDDKGGGGEPPPGAPPDGDGPPARSAPLPPEREVAGTAPAVASGGAAARGAPTPRQPVLTRSGPA